MKKHRKLWIWFIGANASIVLTLVWIHAIFDITSSRWLLVAVVHFLIGALTSVGLIE